MESGRQELALAQDELAAARVSLEQEFEVKSADVASREESLARRSAETDERASALQAHSDELAAAVANLDQDRQALEQENIECTSDLESKEDAIQARMARCRGRCVSPKETPLNQR